jgi:hypothetical protein
LKSNIWLIIYKINHLISRKEKKKKKILWRTSSFIVGLMVFNATFNIFSVISWQSLLLVEETGVPRENYRPAASHWQTLSHNVSSTPRPSWIRTHISGDRHWFHNINGMLCKVERWNIFSNCLWTFVCTNHDLHITMKWGCRGHMVVGFIATYAISAYHH